MENTSDSEVANSCNSLSHLSEPPKIRNWFPSYKYESFVLDTYDAFGGSVFKESDCEGYGLEKQGNLAESRRNTDCDDKGEEQPLSRMTDSTCSLSLLSESITIESECEKGGFASEGSKRKREHNFDKSRNSWNHSKVDVGGEKLCPNVLVECENSVEDTCVNRPSSELPDSSQPSAILSEPPDIKNWFFSYEYESPESNGYVDQETEYNKDDLVKQQNNKEKERNLWKFRQTRIADEVAFNEKVLPNGFLKLSSSLIDNEKENQSLDEGIRASGNGNSSALDNLCCERRQGLEDKIFPNHRISSTKDTEKSLNDECPPCNQQQKQNFLQEADCVSCQRSTNSSNNNRISPIKLICHNDLAENLKTKAQAEVNFVSPASNMSFIQVAKDLMRKSSHGSNDKENEGKEVPENGFVTTKKNRQIQNDENSLHKPQKILSECSRNKRITLSECGNEAMKRKVLSETTNLEHINAIEVTGEWRCPQKTKPNVGPPLKQLRLEKWVHRL